MLNIKTLPWQIKFMCWSNRSRVFGPLILILPMSCNYFSRKLLFVTIVRCACIWFLGGSPPKHRGARRPPIHTTIYISILNMQARVQARVRALTETHTHTLTHSHTHTHTHTHTHAQPWYAHTQAHARALSHTPTLRTVQHSRALASISTCRINSIVAALRAYDFGKSVCILTVSILCRHRADIVLILYPYNFDKLSQVWWCFIDTVSIQY